MNALPPRCPWCGTSAHAVCLSKPAPVERRLPQVGDIVRVPYLNATFVGRVEGFRAQEDEPEPLVIVHLDTQRGSTVLIDRRQVEVI